MKKLLTLFLATLMILGCAFTFTACGDDEDVAYVKDKGTLIVGITDFAPMDYKDTNGDWIGFDADLAKLFAEKLGVNVQFVEIEWGNKIMELQNRTIDCVWNGMTLTDEVKAGMACSNPYLNNAQLVVVNSAVAAQYQTKEACASLRFAAEDGSAGEAAALANGWNVTAVENQAAALMEVAAGTADAAIIDSLMAGAMIGEGTSYANLTGTIKLTTEEYGIGFRVGSGLAEELNEFMTELKENGKLEELAVKYGVQEALIQ